MSIVFSGLSPHPPLLVPEIGQENLAQVERSRAALQELCREFVSRQPETLIIVTPHGPVRPDGISVLATDSLQASFNHFPWTCQLAGDVPLADAICEEAQRSGFPTIRFTNFDSGRNYFSSGLDHATMVPLYYLREAGFQARIIVISMAWWPHPIHYGFGKAIRRAVETTDRRVALLASGDLSHRLIPTAPAGYEPLGAEFDQTITRCLGDMDAQTILGLDEDLVEKIGECGLRPISMLLGALEGPRVTARVLSYEGPFGVGYCVARFDPEIAEDGVASPASCQQVNPAPQAEPDDATTILDLARSSVEAYVRDRRVLEPPERLSPLLLQRAGAFVCLKEQGHLRGCIGTIQPTQSNLAIELIHNAISACSRDPRFPAVRPEELGHLQYSVDVLEEPQAIRGPDELDPRQYGVIIRSGSRSGVLLPNLEGIDDIPTQVQVVRNKAGIEDGDPNQEYMRFKVRRYEPLPHRTPPPIEKD